MKDVITIMNIYTYNTSLGDVTIASDGKAITLLKLGSYFKMFDSDLHEEAIYKTSYLTDLAVAQLEEYLTGERKNFDLPIIAKGTDFQMLVWNALRTIPYGETRSYKQVAEMINRPKACRAVGLANNKNPIWIIIPCHRVIGSNGSLTGYGGGLDIKQKLLILEQENS